MQTAYIQVIVMLHGAFALVFYFLDQRSPSRFARLFALSWAIEAVRAAIVLPGVSQIGGGQEEWFAASDLLCFVANWWLLAGCADLAGVRLPRWLAPLYFWSGMPVVLFNRFILPDAWALLAGVPAESVRFTGILINLTILFVPVAAARLTILRWLMQLWRETHLSGAMIAAIFCVPYAVLALAVPFQFYFDYSPDWIALIWCARVLGFSIGLVMLMLDFQHAAGARSEASLAAAQALAKVGSWEMNVMTGVSSWSAEMFQLYDCDPAQGVIDRQKFLARMHPADRETFLEQERRALEQRCSADHEFRVRRADGTVRWIHGRKTPLFDGTGKLIRLIGVEQNITERKQAEWRSELHHAVTRALAEAEPVEQTMAKIVEIVARGLGAEFAAYWSFDRSDGTLHCAQLWHAPAAALAAFAEASRSAVFVSGVGLPGMLLAAREPVFVGEADMERGPECPRCGAAGEAGLKCGSGFPILLHGELHGVVEFFATEAPRGDPEILKLFGDLSTQIGQFIDRQRFAERLRQAQKLEAVGTLAGGIAHDFNNILTAISGYTELAQADTANQPATQTRLRAVQTATRRAIDLVRQIKTFSRQEEQVRVPLALAPTVREALQLLRATIPATIAIELHEDGEMPPVLADATAIHQIIVNLGTNASHAMQGLPGRIDVGLEATVVDARFVVAHPGLQPGRYVRLTFRDTGMGIEPATRARIFEPFFTTKAPGEGTGLGLAVVHGIVQSHHGAIFVQSEPGAGTEFTIYFPAESGTIAPPAAEPPPAMARGAGERVMYVDDEPMLTDMGRTMLSRLGYEVEVFEEPDKALAALRGRAGEFRLLVTDLTMSGMTGLELAHEARRLRRDLPIVLTSGNASALKEEQLREAGICEFLVKPYSVHTFSTVIRRALATTDGGVAPAREGA